MKQELNCSETKGETLGKLVHRSVFTQLSRNMGNKLLDGAYNLVSMTETLE